MREAPKRLPLLFQAAAARLPLWLECWLLLKRSFERLQRRLAFERQMCKSAFMRCFHDGTAMRCWQFAELQKSRKSVAKHQPDIQSITQTQNCYQKTPTLHTCAAVMVTDVHRRTFPYHLNRHVPILSLSPKIKFFRSVACQALVSCARTMCQRWSRLKVGALNV